jgi:hypothetical protein
MLVLPVAKFSAISTLVIRLWPFALSRFSCYLYFQGPSLKL